MNKTTIPLLSAPFRVFFPLCAIAATFIPMYIVTILVNQYPHFSTTFAPIAWHGHEMIFGYAMALLCGFLLTAGSHWVGRPMPQGKILIVLAFLWIMERVLMFSNINALWPALFGIAFMLTFIGTAIKLLKGYKQAFLFGTILSLFFIAKLLYLASVFTEYTFLLKYGENLAIGLFRVLLIIIAGRLIPNFSKNKLKEYAPIIIPELEKINLITALLIIPITVFLPNTIMASFIFLFAFLTNKIRFALWRPEVFFKDPLLGILGIGYIWILVSLLLDGLSPMIESINIGRGALHALGLGAIGVLSMAIMIRASLGHTGRKIIMNNWFLFIFILINLGAFLRVFIPMFGTKYYLPSLHVSMGIWTLGFIIFIVYFAKAFVMPRVDGK